MQWAPSIAQLQWWTTINFLEGTFTGGQDNILSLVIMKSNTTNGKVLTHGHTISIHMPPAFEIGFPLAWVVHSYRAGEGGRDGGGERVWYEAMTKGRSALLFCCIYPLADANLKMRLLSLPSVPGY